MKKIIKWLVLAIIVVVILTSILGNGSSDNSDAGATDDSSQAIAQVNSDKTDTTTKKESYKTTLTAGNYTVGIDIPEGTYNLKAVKGSGNVSSSNMYSGGLNEIMSKNADEYSIDSFSNASFTSGDVLSISSNLELKISSKEVDLSSMSKRKTDKKNIITLSSGNFTVGTDLPAGTYNIKVVKGNGNVSSDNMYDGGLNEIMGTDSDDMYIKEFKNTSFTEGTVLTISSVTIELTPLK